MSGTTRLLLRVGDPVDTRVRLVAVPVALGLVKQVEGLTKIVS